MPRNARTSLAAAAAGERVDTTALAPDGSYGVPDFVTRGYYVDRPFTCQDCGKAECGQRRSKNGGMKWRKVACGQRRGGDVPVGSKSGSVARKRSVSIWKDWHVNRESQKHEPG